MISDQIIQLVHDRHDHLPRRAARSRITSVEKLVRARRAARKGDPYIAEKLYAEVASELRGWSAESVHEIANLIDREAWRLRNGG